MNFRTCKYFLTVCDMGTINGAARALYISPQSLSQHIRKLEEELGVQLFHRDNPLTLTEAGQVVQSAATDILGRLEDMETELKRFKDTGVQELTIGFADYGIPEFFPALADAFIKENPEMLLRIQEVKSDEAIPTGVPLVISAREMGHHAKNELLFTDSLVVCVSDTLLQKQYYLDWKKRKQRLEQGDLTALEGCPFARHRNTPLEKLADMVFANNGFTPTYLPVMGNADAFSKLCKDNQVALITFLGQALQEKDMPPYYRIPNIPEYLPAGYICYSEDRDLSDMEKNFVKIAHKFVKRGNRETKVS